MKRWIGLLMIMSLFMANVAFAAVIPEKTGLVQDNAGMFTSKEITTLEKKAEGDTLTFHILTMNSLDGQDVIQQAGIELESRYSSFTWTFEGRYKCITI